MKNIPPEIDDLMWRLAEEGGPVAQAEFEARHTRYGPELTRRIRMVAELRNAGKPVTHRPAFTPRPVRVEKSPQWAVAGVVCLAVFAVGAVAYVTASAGEKPPKVVPIAIPPKENFPPVTVATTPGPAPTPPPTVSPPPPKEDPNKEDPKPVTPAYMLPRDVRIADTALTAAISLVAAGGHLEATIAPGFEDRRVSLDYRGLNTLDTLKAMGEEYGFSVLQEEDGHVLVVPARAKTEEPRRVGP